MSTKKNRTNSKPKDGNRLCSLTKIAILFLLLFASVTAISTDLQFRSVRHIQTRGGWVRAEPGYLNKMLHEKIAGWLEENYGPYCLTPFGVIESVGLADTSVINSDLIALKNLPHLKRLNLIGTKITDDGLIHLKNLRKLDELQLDDTQVTDNGLAHLKNLTNLEGLYLPKQISDAGLIHLSVLTNLTELQLYNTKVTDAGLIHLEGLIHLKTLFLGKTKVTDAGVQRLQKALPKCYIEY